MLLIWHECLYLWPPGASTGYTSFQFPSEYKCQCCLLGRFKYKGPLRVPCGHGGMWPWWEYRHPQMTVLSCSSTPDLGSVRRHVRAIVMEPFPTPQVQSSSLQETWDLRLIWLPRISITWARHTKLAWTSAFIFNFFLLNLSCASGGHRTSFTAF